jgi:hypothetical protein
LRPLSPTQELTVATKKTKHKASDSHNKAAAHHSTAAHHHRMAAHHHDHGQHDQAKEHAASARNSSDDSAGETTDASKGSEIDTE